LRAIPAREQVGGGQNRRVQHLRTRPVTLNDDGSGSQ
jgi:hypothetical protein